MMGTLVRVLTTFFASSSMSVVAEVTFFSHPAITAMEPASGSYLSQFMTLLPGDIITTGTPAGVGLGWKPVPWYVKPGDVVALGIERLGIQRQEVLSYHP